MSVLKWAIENKQAVSFSYTDVSVEEEGRVGKRGRRVGNPHAIWRDHGGTVYLHLWADPRSSSASGRLPGWRTYIVGRMTNVAPEESPLRSRRPQKFANAPGWNPAWYSREGTPIAITP